MVEIARKKAGLQARLSDVVVCQPERPGHIGMKAPSITCCAIFPPCAIPSVLSNDQWIGERRGAKRTNVGSPTVASLPSRCPDGPVPFV